MKKLLMEALEALAERQAEDAIGPSDTEVVIEDVIDAPSGVLVRLSDGRAFMTALVEVKTR